MQYVDRDELEVFARDIIAAMGTDDDTAERVANLLVAADVRGHGSHGVRRLGTLYTRMIHEDRLRPGETPEVVDEAPAGVSLDAKRGWGHAAGAAAIEHAIEGAKDRGISLSSVRNATHMGRIGAYAERAADEGLLCSAYVNTGGTGANMAAPGSSQRRLANNPRTIGIPTYDVVPFSLVYDVALTVVAHGKIMKKAIAGEPLPEGWAVSDSGEPLLDAQAYEDGEGALLPVGGEQFGYKGAGLSIVTELLVGFLSDNDVFGQVEGGLVNNGAAFVVIDPELFASADANRDRVTAFVDYIRDIDYRDEISIGEAWGESGMLPGEPEHLLKAEREEAGIPLDDRAVAMLAETADEWGVEDLPASFDG